MARIIQDVCDRCGSVRGSANHWWLSYQTQEGVSRLIAVRPFDPEIGTKIVVEPRLLCGEACVLAEVSEFMSSGIHANAATAVLGTERISLKLQTHSR